MKQIVVTGATSFLGSNVIRELLKANCIIYALVRKESPNISQIPQSNKVQFCYGALNNIKEALQTIKSADVFIHFAWDGSGDKGRGAEDIQMKNVQYAMDALQVAQRLGCRQFIFPGSQAEYGIKHHLISEVDSTDPISPYGKAKEKFAYNAQEYCNLYDINFIHLRIFSVYGYGDRVGTLTDSCMRTFLKNGEISIGACLQQWNYLYINDFSRIICEMIKNDCPAGIYNIASDDTRQLREFVKEIHDVIGRRGSYNFENQVSKPEGVPDLNPSITKLKKILPHFEFTTFHDGIMETIDQLEKE